MPIAAMEKYFLTTFILQGLFNWQAIFLTILTASMCSFNLTVKGSSSCYVYPPSRKDPCQDKKCNFGARLLTVMTCCFYSIIDKTLKTFLYV